MRACECFLWDSEKFSLLGCDIVGWDCIWVLQYIVGFRLVEATFAGQYLHFDSKILIAFDFII